MRSDEEKIIVAQASELGIIKLLYTVGALTLLIMFIGVIIGRAFFMSLKGKPTI